MLLQDVWYLEKMAHFDREAVPERRMHAKGSGAFGTFTVKRPLVAPRLVLHVEPVIASRVAALAPVLGPASRAHVDPNLVAGALGLTPAESRVAVLPAQGNTLRDIAMATGCRKGAIRWRLKHVFAKHGISRHAELVRLSLSVMREARR